MAIDPTSSVTVIEGIGAARAEALAAIHVFNVFDLLRCTVSQLYEPVKTSVSEDQVRSWQNMAGFLQVEQVTRQWAEALDSGGIESINELSTKKLDELHVIFTKAHDENLIPEVPTPNQMTEMIKDATIICRSGALTLTVTDRDGNPVVGAEARIGVNKEQTDARGRVRLVRVPLGTGLPLVVEHGEYGLLIIEDPPIVSDHQSIGVEFLTMPQRGTADDASSIRLSEYDGDTIPLGGNIPTRQVTLAHDMLREGDLLTVFSLYKSTPDAKLTSMLREYSRGEITIFQYRIPLSAFDVPPQVGDTFTYRSGTFFPRKRTVDRINRYRKRRKLAKVFADRPVPSTMTEKLRDIEERITWMQENDGFKGHARWKV